MKKIIIFIILFLGIWFYYVLDIDNKNIIKDNKILKNNQEINNISKPKISNKKEIKNKNNFYTLISNKAKFKIDFPKKPSFKTVDRSTSKVKAKRYIWTFSDNNKHWVFEVNATIGNINIEKLGTIEQLKKFQLVNAKTEISKLGLNIKDYNYINIEGKTGLYVKYGGILDGREVYGEQIVFTKDYISYGISLFGSPNKNLSMKKMFNGFSHSFKLIK